MSQKIQKHSKIVTFFSAMDGWTFFNIHNLFLQPGSYEIVVSNTAVVYTSLCNETYQLQYKNCGQ